MTVDRTQRGLLASVLRHPAQSAKNPPCSAACAAGGDVLSWIGIVAQRRKLGLTDDEAFAHAWRIIASVNPFPATLGRICPHPCENGCNRADEDGAVSIKALERFLGDWALEKALHLPALDEGEHPESIGVIGSGPAGLSFAYQMARRGYRVTVYEKENKPGGMLQHGIPEYRLPETIVARESARLADIGIEFRLGVTIGRDIAVDELRYRHAAVFLGIGAPRGLRLDIPGEGGPGVWSGVEYLAACRHGAAIALGNAVVVVGGGNTAIDAARTARRAGARVTLLYRRTADEMHAIPDEVEEALSEEVVIAFLAAPIRIERSADVVTGVLAQRMQTGEPDASGRPRPIPREDSEFTVPANSVIEAVSRAPDWSELGIASESVPFPSLESWMLAGGDVLGLGIAGSAIVQGRRAADALHAKLRGFESSPPTPPRSGDSPHVKPDYYAPSVPIATPKLSVAARLRSLDAEVAATITEEQFTSEVQRCFSCGSCFGCEQCYMYCSTGAITRLALSRPWTYFSLSLDRCEGCGKCIEVCPSGFLSVSPAAR